MTATQIRSGLLAVVFLLGGAAQAQATDRLQGTAPLLDRRPRCVRVEAFLVSGKSQSEQARRCLAALQAERPGVLVEFHDVDEPASVARLEQLAKHYRIAASAAPAFHLSGQLIQGWDERETPQQLRHLLTIEVFVRAGCPRCAQAKGYLAGLPAKYPGFVVQFRDAVQDPRAAADFQALCRAQNVRAPSFPGVRIGPRVLVGFLGENTTGKRIEALLDQMTVACPDKPRPASSRQGADRRDPAQGLQSARATPPGALFHAEPAYLVFGALAVAADPTEQSSTPAAGRDGRRLPIPEDLPSEQPAVELEALDMLPDASSVDSDAIEVPLFGSLRAGELGLPAFTIAIGLIDGFNPCAMWVLLILLSVLVNLQDRRKIVLVAGTFVAVSGLAYFAFMAAWLNVFALIGLARPAQIGLALAAIIIGAIDIKDFFALRRGVTLSIPEAAKPRIYAKIQRIMVSRSLLLALTGALGLAVLVNIVELLCTAGLPALYTEILTLRGLPTWQNYMYLGLYIAAYMLDDTVMVGLAVMTMAKTKLQERGGRWLKLLCGAVILTLGLVMLVRPEWLS